MKSRIFLLIIVLLSTLQILFANNKIDNLFKKTKELPNAEYYTEDFKKPQVKGVVDGVKAIEVVEADIDNATYLALKKEIEEALNKHIERIQIELAGQGMQLEQYLQMMGTDQDNLRKQLEPSAKQQAIFEAIIDEIVRQENIEISEEELNQQIDAIASYNQISAEDVLKQVNKEDLKRDYSRIKASQIVINAAVEK